MTDVLVVVPQCALDASHAHAAADHRVHQVTDRVDDGCRAGGAGPPAADVSVERGHRDGDLVVVHQRPPDVRHAHAAADHRVHQVADRVDDRCRAGGAGPLTGQGKRRGQRPADDTPADAVPLGKPSQGQTPLGVPADRAVKQVGALGRIRVPARDRRAPAGDQPVDQGPFEVPGRTAGEDGKPLQTRFAGPVRRAAGHAVQGAGPQMVGPGQAPDVVLGALAQVRTHPQRQRRQRLRLGAPGRHRACSFSPAGQESELWSRGIASRPPLVISSLPVRIASRAAPRIRWESEPIMPPVRS